MGSEAEGSNKPEAEAAVAVAEQEQQEEEVSQSVSCWIDAGMHAYAPLLLLSDADGGRLTHINTIQRNAIRCDAGGGGGDHAGGGAAHG